MKPHRLLIQQYIDCCTFMVKWNSLKPKKSVNGKKNQLGSLIEYHMTIIHNVQLHFGKSKLFKVKKLNGYFQQLANARNTKSDVYHKQLSPSATGSNTHKMPVTERQTELVTHSSNNRTKPTPVEVNIRNAYRSPRSKRCDRMAFLAPSRAVGRRLGRAYL